MSKSKLKPCPFCGEKKEIWQMRRIWQYYILCRICGARGPTHDDPGWATRKWNEREDDDEAPI